MADRSRCASSACATAVMCDRGWRVRCSSVGSQERPAPTLNLDAVNNTEWRRGKLSPRSDILATGPELSVSLCVVHALGRLRLPAPTRQPDNGAVGTWG